MRVYVAGPYSKGDQIANVRAAIMVGDRLLVAGAVPYIPHLTAFWHLLSPHPYQEWLDLDLEWLRQCQAIIRLPGESSGADGEVAEAIAWGIPVFRDVETLCGWMKEQEGA